MIDSILSGFNQDPVLNQTIIQSLLQSVETVHEKNVLKENLTDTTNSNIQNNLKLSKRILIRFYMIIYNNLSVNNLLFLVKNLKLNYLDSFKLNIIQTLYEEFSKHSYSDKIIYNIHLSAWPAKGPLVIKEVISTVNNYLDQQN